MASFTKTGKTIVAVARNYVAHAKELGNATPEVPFYFFKPVSSYLCSGGKILLPVKHTVHHEVELAVVVGKTAHRVHRNQAMEHVAGYAAAIDVTDRTAQEEAKSLGRPWALAKGRDTFCPVTDFVPAHEVPDPHDVELELRVNETIRQKDSTKLMIFRIPVLLEAITSAVTLHPGDVVLTGTPSGVNTLEHGDKVSVCMRTGDKVLAEGFWECVTDG